MMQCDRHTRLKRLSSFNLGTSHLQLCGISFREVVFWKPCSTQHIQLLLDKRPTMYITAYVNGSLICSRPHQVYDRGPPIPMSWSCPGERVSMFWSYPGKGVAVSCPGGGVPVSWSYPKEGVSISCSCLGERVPMSWSCLGDPSPGQDMSRGYSAGSTPFAVTQKDFLVLISVLSSGKDG